MEKHRLRRGEGSAGERQERSVPWLRPRPAAGTQLLGQEGPVGVRAGGHQQIKFLLEPRSGMRPPCPRRQPGGVLRPSPSSLPPRAGQASPRLCLLQFTSARGAIGQLPRYQGNTLGLEQWERGRAGTLGPHHPHTRHRGKQDTSILLLRSLPAPHSASRERRTPQGRGLQQAPPLAGFTCLPFTTCGGTGTLISRSL